VDYERVYKEIRDSRGEFYGLCKSVMASNEEYLDLDDLFID
jgi:hypothetical protein